MQQAQQFLSALESITARGFMLPLLNLHRADVERVLTSAGN